jgi:hypothetical protein
MFIYSWANVHPIIWDIVWLHCRETKECQTAHTWVQDLQLRLPEEASCSQVLEPVQGPKVSEVQGSQVPKVVQGSQVPEVNTSPKNKAVLATMIPLCTHCKSDHWKTEFLCRLLFLVRKPVCRWYRISFRLWLLAQFRVWKFFTLSYSSEGSPVLVYEGVGGVGVVGSHPISTGTAVHIEPKCPNKLWRSNSIFSLWKYGTVPIFSSVRCL